MIRRLGYCCINLELKEELNITTNRGMKKATFEKKGINYARELAKHNLVDLLHTLQWNERNGIKLFRITSQLFPWSSHYELKDLPNFDDIHMKLMDIGDFIKGHDHRVSFHPGPFNVLGSDNLETVNKTIRELNQHSEILDLMGLERTHYYPINVHLNTTKGGKDEVIYRFIENFKFLSSGTKKRLVIENDDSPNQYDVLDLYEVYKRIGTPITFDYLHFILGPKYNYIDGTYNYNSEKFIATLLNHFFVAFNTWGKVTPLFHYSESRLLEEKDCRAHSHSDYYLEYPLQPEQHMSQLQETYSVDIDLECKMKEKSLFKMKNSKNKDMSIAKKVLALPKTDPQRKPLMKIYFPENFAKEYPTDSSLPGNEILSLLKGDLVKGVKDGFPFEGKIVKYSSNKSIGIEPKTNNPCDEILFVCKEDIKEKL